MPPSPDGPFACAAEGLKVTVRLQPGASRAAVEGLAELADGTAVLEAKVGQPPECGNANAALITLLATTWGLPKGTLRIVAGQKNRQKTLLIAGDPDDLRASLERWLADHNREPGREHGLTRHSGT